VLSVAAAFALPLSRARLIARKVAGAVRQWRKVAKRHGVGKREVDRMASAFEHEDLRLALR
jgi:serine/threonine-protein kinase HipA